MNHRCRGTERLSVREPKISIQIYLSTGKSQREGVIKAVGLPCCRYIRVDTLSTRQRIKDAF